MGKEWFIWNTGIEQEGPLMAGALRRAAPSDTAAMTYYDLIRRSLLDDAGRVRLGKNLTRWIIEKVTKWKKKK